MGRNLSVRTRRQIARGINAVNRRAIGGRYTRGLGNRATLATLGTGNSAYNGFAETPGTAGNSITFRIVVAGANTAASVAVVGNAVTFNSATNGSSVATSTVNAMIDAVNRAQALIWLQRPAGSDGTGVVAAVAATNLTGGS